MFSIEYLQTNMRCLFEKNLTSKLDKSGKVLIHCIASIGVHVPWHTSETMWSSVSRQKKFNLCLDVG